MPVPHILRIIPALLLCCAVTLAHGDNIQLQDGHPDRYVVVKGDTLWAIAGRFLKDPWRWPEVWKLNREQIKNPHWIYPGDVVVLDASSGQPELHLLRETVVLQAEAHEEALARNAIPAISPSVIAPFLTQPLVVDESSLSKAPEIVAAEDERILLGAGHKAYISRIEEGDGNTWQLYQQGNPLIDPDTKKTLGYEAIHLGDARVTRYGAPATVEITRSRQEAKVGDKLVKMPNDLMPSFVPHAPENEISGLILSISGGMAEAGRNSIVSINRGRADGLEVGHVLAINRKGETLEKKSNPQEHIPRTKLSRDSEGKTLFTFDKGEAPLQLPDERVGLLMVFRTFEHVSYALVMQSALPIHILDKIHNP